jgi:Flp pilus assembly protein CpaB
LAAKRIDKGAYPESTWRKSELEAGRLMPKLATNVIVGKLLPVSAALALLMSCGDKAQVVPRVQIPRGMRAVSVRSNIAVAPGDHVDVLVVGKGQETNTVLENVEVAAAEKESRVVTLLVSPDDAQRVTDALEHGKFRLLLGKSD